MRPAWRAVLLWALLCPVLAAQAATAVELDYRLRAGRDLISEQVVEDVTTVRVLDDRGLVARTAAAGVQFPTTRHHIQRERFRFTTGETQADGSFAATLSVLQRRTSLRLFNGEELAVSGQPVLDNLRFEAVIDGQGQLQQPSLRGDGLDGTGREAVQSLLASVLEQAIRVDILRVDADQPAQQVVNTALSLPGLPPVDLRISTSNRLIDVVDGQARIELIYVLEFRLPDGPLKLDASGTGGGTLVYDTDAKLARRIETSTLMTVVTELPDGTLEMQLNSRRIQTTRPAAP